MAVIGDCAFGRIAASLVACALLWPVGAGAADRPGAPDRPVGGAVKAPSIAPQADSTGADQAPVDSDTQMREIERTKRLMKELGAMHGGGGAMAPAKGAGGIAAGIAVPNATPSAEAPAAESEFDLTKNASVREAATVANKTVRDVAGDSPRVSGNPGSGSAGGGLAEVAESPSRPSKPEDEQRMAELLHSLADEMLPWIIGFGILFAIGYGGISWASARAGGTRHSSGGSRRGHRSHRSSGSGRRGESSERRRSRSSRSGRHEAWNGREPRPPSA